MIAFAATAWHHYDHYYHYKTGPKDGYHDVAVGSPTQSTTARPSRLRQRAPTHRGSGHARRALRLAASLVHTLLHLRGDVDVRAAVLDDALDELCGAGTFTSTAAHTLLLSAQAGELHVGGTGGRRRRAASAANLRGEVSHKDK